MHDKAQSEDSVTSFSLTFSTDRKGFFRRTCPSCGRDFKTEVNEADFVSSLQPAFARLEAEIGERLLVEKQDAMPEHLYCPYCQYYAESGELLTETFVAYLRRLFMREYVLPMMHKALAGIAESFQGLNRGQSRGLISIDVTFMHEQPILPPRPISGPEPPDMVIVELLCCGKKVKVLDEWTDLERCPYCGAQISVQ